MTRTLGHASDLVHRYCADIPVQRTESFRDLEAGWKAHGRGERPASKRGLGYDYVHAAVDDHSRPAYAEILPDEQGPTCAQFLLRANAFFAAHGITVREVISDNALNYIRSTDFKNACAAIGARHLTIKPH